MRQLLENTYDIAEPEVVLVWLTGAPAHGVGPHDVAIALCGAVYERGFVKNKILEFAGPGVSALPMDYRIGIDVMTTETACLSSIWTTDERVREYLTLHGRPEAYRAMAPEEGAVYDAMIEIDLSSLEPMAALRELIANPGDILRECERKNPRLRLTDKLQGGKLSVNQGIIAGCAGGMYDNLAAAASILKNRSTGNGGFSLSVYPSSAPQNLALMRSGIAEELMMSGAVIKPAFCGPCFGAGDTPSNDAISIRHTTRNFPNREGSKPGEGQISSVFLMDARSIAATAANGGVLTSAADVDYDEPRGVGYIFDGTIYSKRVYDGWGRANSEEKLIFGPNIVPWPSLPPLPENLLLRLDSVIRDPVTTTDELIPSGETSSYRSNPLRLAEFTLSRRDPGYVGRTKETKTIDPQEILKKAGIDGEAPLASAIYAILPGDGSAREQAASCQRVLGGGANIVRDFATKRYRSNVINWGMLPLYCDGEFSGEVGGFVYLPGVRKIIESGRTEVPGVLISGEKKESITFRLPPLTVQEREILLAGCLMNWYKSKKEG